MDLIERVARVIAGRMAQSADLWECYVEVADAVIAEIDAATNEIPE